MEWMLVKTVGSLALVLALMGGLGFLFRRYVLRSGPRRGETVAIDVLGSRSLGPRRSVQVLRVMNRIIVVGVSDHGMQTLSEMPGDSADPDGLRGTEGSGPSAGLDLPGNTRADFPSYLRAALGFGARRSRAQVKETV